MFLGHPISRQAQIALSISQPNVVVSPCVSRSDTVGANVPRAGASADATATGGRKHPALQLDLLWLSGLQHTMAGDFAGFETIWLFSGP